MSPLASINLPPGKRRACPINAGIFGLSTHKVCHQASSLMLVVSSCLALSPLPPPGGAGGFSFCGTCCQQDSFLPAAFPLGSMVARVARTFLPQPPQKWRTAGDRVGHRRSFFKVHFALLSNCKNTKKKPYTNFFSAASHHRNSTTLPVICFRTVGCVQVL